MCGIAGIITKHGHNDARKTVVAMQSRLKHRGPDDQGVFVDQTGMVAFAHSRLSILDLSSAGHQPMISSDGQFVIVFNGEIYNFRTIQQQLMREGVCFQSDSDTEVLLYAYIKYGRRCVDLLQGMFAFAVWDTKERSLFLARDSFGIKPIYLWQTESSIAFASEIRAVLAAELDSRQINHDALVDYLSLGSVQEPDTLVKGVTVLPAGHSMYWSDGQSEVASFWQLSFATSVDKSPVTSEAEAIQLTRSSLQASLDRHFVSDVPVGIFLSGGIDSTSILAVAKTTGYDRLQTYCISFEDKDFDEGELASRTAKHFGTLHTEWKMTASNSHGLVEQYLAAMDQPSNDGFNTFCVSKLARDNGMKVVLSGLGGDELFAGYPSFQKIPKLLHLFERLSWIHGRSAASLFLKKCTSDPRMGRIADYLVSDGRVRSAWRAMRGFFTEIEVEKLVCWITGKVVSRRSDDVKSINGILSETIAEQISRCELTGYMRNQLLRDSDVMSMAWGLELRVPFVDRGFVEDIATIDSSIRLRTGKHLLRQAVPELPDWILKQPKRGFRFPFERWARDSWASVVQELEPRLPVRCGAWHRFWSLLVLRHFLMDNKIEGAAGFTSNRETQLAQK